MSDRCLRGGKFRFGRDSTNGFAVSTVSCLFPFISFPKIKKSGERFPDEFSDQDETPDDRVRGGRKGNIMCFRPPDTTSGPLICPSCGKKIVSPNFRPVVCPFCKEPLPPEGAAPAAAAPSQPGGPSAPGAPGAPKPPTA